MSDKINKDTICRRQCLLTAPMMDRVAMSVSESVGGNRNKQNSIAHGYQILVLREMQKRGINTKKIYAHINH